VTRRKLVVPILAAALGSAVTAAALVAGGGTGPVVREQGLLARGSGDRLSAHDIYERAAPGIVYIRARSVHPEDAFQAQTGGSTFPAQSTGSGFVLDSDGHVVTNAHVVAGVTDVQVTFPDGRIEPARVLGKDEETDLAVLTVDPARVELHPLELGDSSAVRLGDRVMAVGNPTGLQPTAGTGRISATGRRIEAPGGYLIDGMLETDAVIEPATSGGPLMGADGRVVGVVSRLTEAGGEPGYAVPVNTMRDVLTQLEERHKVIRPYIGLEGRTSPDGVQILQVDPGGPADRAGLHSGDVIEAIDGQAARTLGGLLGEVASRHPGDSVELRVLRNGNRSDVEVQLDERPATIPAG
jgi:S1-C subfamily serine protease